MDIFTIKLYVLSLLLKSDSIFFWQIIPIEGDLIINDETQKTFEEILPEIVISKYDSFLSHRPIISKNKYMHQVQFYYLYMHEYVCQYMSKHR